MKLAAFKPFTSAADALEQCNAVSEGAQRAPPPCPPSSTPAIDPQPERPACAAARAAGILTDSLKAFLEQSLPSVKPGKKPKFSLGVGEPKLGSAILDAASIPCESNDRIGEVSMLSRRPNHSP